jgi:hypothetical protein
MTFLWLLSKLGTTLPGECRVLYAVSCRTKGLYMRQQTKFKTEKIQFTEHYFSFKEWAKKGII